MDRSKYLAGVDGLRAIAVMSVVLFHAKFTGFRGGFVGVDVFFVISGFLITRLIVTELEENGRLDFAAFYARRARRLFPALFTVLLLSFCTAFLLFTAKDFQEFGGELTYGLVSLSNVYFWMHSGYFETASGLKPLLHTWSLGVEEQFYLVWPIAIAAIFRRFGKLGLWAALAIGVVGDLLLNKWMLSSGYTFLLARLSGLLSTFFSNGSSAIFYLTPFRIFEFSIGAALVWLRPLKSNWVQEVLMAFGLASVAYSVIAFDERMPFPSYNALVPCVGSALIILSIEAQAVGSIVRSRLAVLIGRSSYSIYLVHWPLMAFYRYWRMAEPTFAERCTLVLASLATGYLLYRLIETPVRNRKVLPNLTASGVGFVSLLLILLSTLPMMSVRTTGWDWRISAHPQNTDEIVGRLGCTIYCEFGNPNGMRVLLIGDSHSDQYSKTLKTIAGDRYHFYQVYSPSCFFGKTMHSWPNASLGPGCLEANTKLHELLSTKIFTAIIVAERWPGYRDILVKGDKLLNLDNLNDLYPKMLNDIAALYKGFRGSVIIVGHAPNSNFACYMRPDFIPCPTISLSEHVAFRKAYEAFAMRATLHVKLVAPVATICPHGICRILDDNKRMLYADPIHFSVYGAQLIVPQIVANLPKLGAASL